MDHLLKELLDEIKEQNEEVLDNQALIMEKLGIVSNDDTDSDDDNDEDKDSDF